MRTCHLYYRRGTSDKVYIIELIVLKYESVIRVSWGRRGSPNLTSRELIRTGSMATAIDRFEKAKKEKLAKGYVEGLAAYEKKLDLPATIMPEEFAKPAKFIDDNPVRNIKL
mgnify:CR=1 FL=1